MHSFVFNNFTELSLQDKLHNYTVYHGKRRKNGRDVSIFEVKYKTLFDLEKAINQFIGQIMGSDRGRFLVLDWKIDLSGNFIIFSVLPEGKSIAKLFVESSTREIKDMPTRFSYISKSCSRIPNNEGDYSSFFNESYVNLSKGNNNHILSTQMNSLEEMQDCFYDFELPTEAGDLKEEEPKRPITRVKNHTSEKDQLSHKSVDLLTRKTTNSLRSLQSSLDLEFTKSKELLSIDHSQWRLTEYDGQKVYVTFNPGDSKFYIHSEAIIENADIDLLAQMIIKMETLKEWNPHASSMQCLEKLSDSEEIISNEIHLPFPFSNRYVVQRRYYVNNREKPHIFEKMGWKNSKKAWYLFMEPLEDGKYPTKEGLVRAESACVTVFEEIDERAKKVSIKITSKIDLKGKIPKLLLQLCVSKDQERGIKRFLSAYREKYAAKNPTQ